MAGGTSDATSNHSAPSVTETVREGRTPSGGAPPQNPPDLHQHFSSLATNLKTATDPQQQAVAKDKLARTLYATFKDAGHDVKFDGDGIMVVDGRRYIVGGGGTGPGSGGAAPPDLPPMPTMGGPMPRPTMGGPLEEGGFSGGLDVVGGELGEGGLHGAEPGGIFGDQTNPGESGPELGGGEPATPPTGGTAPAGSNPWDSAKGFLVGFDTAKLNDPNKQPGESGKYTPAAKAFAKITQTLGGGRGDLEGWVNAARQSGFPNARSVGDDKIDFGDGAGPIDVVRSDGQVVFQNTTGNANYEATHGGGSSGGGSNLQSMFDRVFGTSPPPSTERNPDTGLIGLGGGGPNPPDVPTTGGGTAGSTGWSPTGPGYTPGTIGDEDLRGLTMDEILARIGEVPTPGTLDTNYQAGRVSNDAYQGYEFGGLGDLGELGAGRTGGQTEDLVSQILANPDTFSPQLRDQLKAKSKDELAEMAKSDDEDLVAQGYLTGNQDSNWLASERMQRKGDRDRALVESNRNVDLAAETENAQSRRSAAALGQSFSEGQAAMRRADASERLAQKQAAEGDLQAAAESRRQAAEYRRQGETINEQLRADAADRNLKAQQQNIDNQFRSHEEKQAAVKLASDTQLAAAAQKGDRRALEESFKQKAAELGQNADKLRLDYTLGLLSDLTTRRGQDLSSDTQRAIAQLGAQVDREKLAQAGKQFQQDLIFRIIALEQADRQFGASYGLDVLKTEHGIDQDMWDRTFGG
jgi:hypothetical protein